MKIKLEDEKCMPTKAHDTDAGFDIYCPKETLLRPGEYGDIDTGLSIEIPESCFGMIVPRSGIGSRGLSLRNTVAIIDSEYRGNIILKVINKGRDYMVINKYERIAQLIIVPFLLVNLEVVSDLEETDRGTQGFGSSGRH